MRFHNLRCKHSRLKRPQENKNILDLIPNPEHHEPALNLPEYSDNIIKYKTVPK